MSLLDHHDALLLDLDGTVWSGETAIVHAVETVNAATARGVSATFITNNASRAPADVAAKLHRIGIAVDESHVLTSAQAAVQLALQHAEPGDAALVVGADSFKDLVRGAGFNLVESADDAPAVVLHGHNPKTGWAELCEAALAIRAGAVYLASNLDSTLPSDRGFLVGNGSMVAAVSNATGVVPEAAGKPAPAMFEMATSRLGVSRPLAVGDRLDTDIAGGVAAEMDTLHVLTGVSGPWALIGAPRRQRPTYIAADMSALTNEMIARDQLRPGPQGGFTAEIVDTAEDSGIAVVLDGGGEGASPIHALRTVLSTVWALPDAHLTEQNLTPVINAVSPAARAAVEGWW